MSLPLSFRKTVTTAVAVMVSVAVGVAAHFSPDGLESAKVGNLPGDQTKPQAAITPWGGYLVWQDNAVDGNGLGVRAQRLDSGLNKTGNPFRVNVIAQGDQENPQVALLRNGSTLFVWQGGRAGAQRIFARVLSSGGTFVSGDIRVNTYTNGFQKDSSVAALADGTAVVAWSSFGQDGSLLGVYAQRLSANGAKLGAEFRVNDATAYNQRSPSVAALTNGNFVVVWISELERAASSVDVFARVFTPGGVPVTGEFAVNSSTNKPCANPSVAASILGGGFAVAWSQDDNERLAISSAGISGVDVSNAVSGKSPRGWDVFGRIYGSTGTPITGEFTMNSTTTGDQYGPVIRGFGDSWVAAWTSYGQDGSREGVYGRFIAADGAPAGDEFLVNTSTASRQIHPVVASDNHATVLAAWSSFHGGGTSFDLYAQKYTTEDVIPLDVLTNLIPPAAEPDTGLPRLDSPGVVTAGQPSDPNLWVASAGTYSGLFFDKYGVNSDSSGFVSIKVTAKGAFSGKVLLSGRTCPIKGNFDESGWGAAVIARPGLMPVNAYLQLDPGGGRVMTGGLTDGDWWSDLHADCQVFNKATRPTAWAGNYTALVSGTGTMEGHSIVVLTVDAGGIVKVSGTLADGTRFTQTTAVSKDGYLPLYVSANKGSTVMLGWIKFESNAESDLTGNVVWAQKAGVSGLQFTDRFALAGSRYNLPPAGQNILAASSGTLSFSGGNITNPFEVGLTFGPNNTVTGGSSLVLRIQPKQGTFKGTVNSPGQAGVVPFDGVILQKTARGGGYFLNQQKSGAVSLSTAR